MKITLINELKAKNSNKNSVNSSIFETLFKAQTMKIPLTIKVMTVRIIV